MSNRKEVVIIGAGVIGCSIAYHLAQKGISSQIIERESIGSRASGKAWAVIPYPPAFFLEENMPDSLRTGSEEETSQFYSMPEGETIANWIELHWSGYYRLSGLAAEIKEKTGIDIEYGEGNNTFLFTSDELESISKEALLSFFKESGVYECQWLDSDTLRSSFPGINPKLAGGVSIPEFQVEPYKFTLGLAQAAENMGAEIRHGDVVGFRTKRDRIVSVKLASGTEVEADTVVMAMGPWSGQGTSLLGKEVPTSVFMTECLRVEVPKKFPLQTISHRHSSIIPKVNGEIILAGSNRLTRHEKDDFDSNLSEEVRIRTMEDVTSMIPDLWDANLVEHRGDLIGCAPAVPFNKPVLGRLPDWENGYVAARFGGLGICLAPGAGAVIADLIADGQVPFRARNMMEHLSPARL